ncbi:hypothetical protein IE81DRAFT_241508 [Ceraceosorus guamensis]|uniref:Uncharacterized protein n=1 Tax=Ceraceosorus guamensis TaxID=1522189 RepID=A0A316W811_9BASI|nr:hypothetical protein IE81DRAFT_241508 [Ceraceosorus guamensis]PWN44871.1 hypothetical protein IE81DRAFT_241508 [Ceraceosorus guamensis]
MRKSAIQRSAAILVLLLSVGLAVSGAPVKEARAPNTASREVLDARAQVYAHKLHGNTFLRTLKNRPQPRQTSAADLPGSYERRESDLADQQLLPRQPDQEYSTADGVRVPRDLGSTPEKLGKHPLKWHLRSVEDGTSIRKIIVERATSQREEIQARAQRILPKTPSDRFANIRKRPRAVVEAADFSTAEMLDGRGVATSAGLLNAQQFRRRYNLPPTSSPSKPGSTGSGSISKHPPPPHRRDVQEEIEHVDRRQPLGPGGPPPYAWPGPGSDTPPPRRGNTQEETASIDRREDRSQSTPPYAFDSNSGASSPGPGASTPGYGPQGSERSPNNRRGTQEDSVHESEQLAREEAGTVSLPEPRTEEKTPHPLPHHRREVREDERIARSRNQSEASEAHGNDDPENTPERRAQEDVLVTRDDGEEWGNGGPAEIGTPPRKRAKKDTLVVREDDGGASSRADDGGSSSSGGASGGSSSDPGPSKSGELRSVQDEHFARDQVQQDAKRTKVLRKRGAAVTTTAHADGVFYLHVLP